MEPLRIVLVFLEAPLPFGNAAARWFYVLLRGLVERGHQVKALAACSKVAEIDQARELFPAPEYDLRLYPVPPGGGLKGKWRTLRRPYSFFFGEEIQRDLEAELAQGYDILHLEQLWTAWIAQEHAERALVNVHHLVGIDLEDAPTSGWRQSLNFRLMVGAERRLVRSMKHFRACSPRLVEPIRKLNPVATIDVVPVGLDPSLYSYIPNEQRGHEPVISLIGSMNWYPGYSAALRLLDRLWPAIKERVPTARLRIIGWSARSALKDYLDRPGVEIIENVPETRPYFEQTSVLLYAPSRGSGMKIKILEAMGFGVPVVTTSEGIEGLPAVDGVHVGTCEDDAGLIERTVALLEDPDRQNRQREAARALLENHCGPQATLDGIEAIYRRMRDEG